MRARALPAAALASALIVGGSGAAPAHEGDASSAQAEEAARKARIQAKRTGAGRWGADYFPNVPLVTHEGETVHFFEDLIEGKIVAINFIFTSCADSCPLETARLRSVQQLLGDRVGSDVFMYSITIDPEVDTPEVLKEYAGRFKVGPGWTFLTGREEDITLLRRKLGLYIDEIQGPDSTDHNLSLIIGNQSTGQWMKRSPFEDSYFLAEQVGSWLSNWRLPGAANQNNYANAPRLRNPTLGENLFRTRCAACHTIGGGDIREVALQRVGPDLVDVTGTRDRDWLVRWLTEPDQMLAEGDPVVMKLYAEYNELAMPNLRLNAREVDALIEYMDEASLRVRKSPRRSDLD